MNERYVPDNQPWPSRPPLYECDNCGTTPAICGRLIELRTGDVWPARDTGFRMNHTTATRVAPPAPRPRPEVEWLIKNFASYIRLPKTKTWRETYLAIRATIICEIGGARV